MRIALAVAETSKHKYRVGACLVKGGSVLSVGFNRRTNDPAIIDWKHCSVHAEEMAFRRGGYPRGAKLYIGRVLRDGTPALAKPCLTCQALIESLDTKAFWTK